MKDNRKNNEDEIELKQQANSQLLSSSSELELDSDFLNKEQNEEDHLSLASAILEVIKRFLPSSLALLIEYSILVLNFTFIAINSDPITTSGCSLGNATINILVFSVGSGFWGGIDTLVSQAFGRKDYYLCGVYLNTSRVVTLALNCVQMILLLNSETLFIWLGQEQATASVAATYMIWILPGLFINMQFECLRRFLLVQGIYKPIMFILSATWVVHIIGLYILIVLYDMKIYGVVISSTLTYLLNLVLLSLYVHCKEGLVPEESWHFFDSNCIQKIPEYLRYALPACLLNMVDWWAFETMVIVCGTISLKSLVSMSIILTITTINFMFAQGISFSWTSLVGNNLGANLPNKARIYSRAALYFGWMWFGSVIIFISVQ